MKQAWWKIGALIFGVAIVAVSVMQVRGQVWAQLGESEEVMEVEVVEEAEEAMVEGSEEVVEEEVSYYLPYPGILPDHPLYWMKMMRDRVVEWLTFEPARKVVLWQLYADKRLGAARALIDGNKVELGVATAEKGAKYQERAVALMEELAMQGRMMREEGERLERATAKHMEVLTDLKERVPQQAMEALERASQVSSRGNERMRQVLERSE